MHFFIQTFASSKEYQKDKGCKPGYPGENRMYGPLVGKKSVELWLLSKCLLAWSVCGKVYPGHAGKKLHKNCLGHPFLYNKLLQN